MNDREALEAIDKICWTIEEGESKAAFLAIAEIDAILDKVEPPIVQSNLTTKKITTEFKFQPLQKVTVTAHGLHIEGARVLRCIWGQGRCIYQVEYAINGIIYSHEFLGDELEAA